MMLNHILIFTDPQHKPPSILLMDLTTSPKTNCPLNTQERKVQGLCYNYDEKYVFGHKCQSKPFLLLLIDDEPPELCSLDGLDPMASDTDSFEQWEEFVYFQLFAQARQDNPSPMTLKFQYMCLSTLEALTIEEKSLKIRRICLDEIYSQEFKTQVNQLHLVSTSLTEKDEIVIHYTYSPPL
ncbi:hypothetical protein Lal_00024249, partial [Lupinus albus]